MLNIDPLYFLLFLEGLLIETIVIILLFLKWQKAKSAFLEASQRVDAVSQADRIVIEEEEISPGEGQNPSLEEKPALSSTEEGDKKILELGEIEPAEEDLKKLVSEKSDIILQMKKKIESMEKKFAEMENEYLILFDKSQKQEQALKAAGLGFDKVEGDF